MRAPFQPRYADFPRIQRPDSALEAPVIVSIPHGGTVFPADERDLYWGGNVDRLLNYADLYTDILFGDAWQVGATVISTPYSRFLIDLNRFPDDLCDEILKGHVSKKEPGYHGVRGVIWAVDASSARIYKRRLRETEVSARLAKYYTPYHSALSAELARLREKFGFVILIDGHSMPSRGVSLRKGAQNERADIVPGDLLGETCAPWVMTTTSAFWSAHGFSVEPNNPYAGGATTRRYAAPLMGVHTIQLELNRGLYMNERNLRQKFSFGRLRRHCTEYVGAMVTAANARSSNR